VGERKGGGFWNSLENGEAYARLLRMNHYSSILSSEEYAELNSRKSYSRFNGKCPTCDDTGEYTFNGITKECEKDFDDICIQKKLFMKYEIANIPYRYQRFDWSTFETQPEARGRIDDYIGNLDEAVRAGLGLYLYSHGLGTGKTLIACHILKEAAKRGHKVYFCSFFELVNIRKENHHLVEKKLTECDIVCIDDVTASKMSEKQSDMFNYVLEKTIRDRVHNAMPTIMTSNLGRQELLKEYDRVFSLLVSSCLTIQLDSTFDYRVDAIQENIEDIFKQNIAPIS
jgi:DNA replication protein DnaC